MIDDRDVEKLTRAVIDLLRQERDAITAGQYGTLKPLNEAKADLLVKLESLELQPLATTHKDTRKRELEALGSIMHRRSQENQKLLNAARTGIKAARAQIDRINNGAETFGAYGPQGQQIAVQSSNRKREQFL